jgi:succinate dehydrogenase hydrophobic anchor subunit
MSILYMVWQKSACEGQCAALQMHAWAMHCASHAVMMQLCCWLLYVVRVEKPLAHSIVESGMNQSFWCVNNAKSSVHERMRSQTSLYVVEP